MPLYTPTPVDRPEFHNQTKRIEPTEEEFLSLFDEAKPSTGQKIYRFFTFLLFLFPVKIIFTITAIIYFAVTVRILGFIHPFVVRPPKDNSDRKAEDAYIKRQRIFRTVAFYVTWPGIRLCLLGIGIVWINRTGKLRPDTRTMVMNHQTIADCIVMMSQFPLCILAMKSLSSSSFIQAITRVFEMIFVDRAKADAHISKKIVEVQEDPRHHLPIMIFPEGKITNGNGLLGFRSGAFISDRPIQGVCIRYKMWLTSYNMATVCWLEPSMLTFLYQILAIPFITVNVDVLDPIDFTKGPKLTPKQKAEKVQLQMANFFGCPAYRKTNKSIFKGKYHTN